MLIMRRLLKTKIKVKLRLCDHCGNEFKVYNSLTKACSIPCAMELGKAKAKKDLEKQIKQEQREWNKEKKERKEKLKTLSDFKHDLEVEINHIVRLIDKGHECISSGAINYKVNAGHLYSVGAFPELRFNLLNIYNQSVGDNLFKGSNGVIYKERIKEVFGVGVSEEIEELKVKYPSLQLSIPELKEKIKEARKAVKYLLKVTEDLEKPYSIEERIYLRRFYNDLIGIYK